MPGPLSHAHSQLVTRNDLLTIPPPPATATWKPIAHYDLIQAIDRQLLVRDIRIVKEEFALAHDGLRLFGVMEVSVPTPNGFGFVLGIRTANDRSFATQLVAGARVFVCDNLAFSGDLIAMNRKHTAHFDLNADLSRAVDRYQHHLGTFGGKFDGLKNRHLRDWEAKEIIFDAFARDIVPIRLFTAVQRTYFHPQDMPDVEPRSMWGLYNSFTRAMKALAPPSLFQSTTKLGPLFGLSATPN